MCSNVYMSYMSFNPKYLQETVYTDPRARFLSFHPHRVVWWKNPACRWVTTRKKCRASIPSTFRIIRSCPARSVRWWPVLPASSAPLSWTVRATKRTSMILMWWAVLPQTTKVTQRNSVISCRACKFVRRPTAWRQIWLLQSTELVASSSTLLVRSVPMDTVILKVCCFILQFLA